MLWGFEVFVRRRAGGAGGASALVLVQRPTVWSDEAEMMRNDGAWTAKEFMPDVWPYSSRAGVRDTGAPGSVDSA